MVTPHADLRLAFYGDDFTGSTDALDVLAFAGLRCAQFLRVPDQETLRALGPFVPSALPAPAAACRPTRWALPTCRWMPPRWWPTTAGSTAWRHWPSMRSRRCASAAAWCCTPRGPQDPRITAMLDTLVAHGACRHHARHVGGRLLGQRLGELVDTVLKGGQMGQPDHIIAALRGRTKTE